MPSDSYERAKRNIKDYEGYESGAKEIASATMHWNTFVELFRSDQYLRKIDARLHYGEIEFRSFRREVNINAFLEWRNMYARIYFVSNTKKEIPKKNILDVEEFEYEYFDPPLIHLYSSYRTPQEAVDKIVRLFVETIEFGKANHWIKPMKGLSFFTQEALIRLKPELKIWYYWYKLSGQSKDSKL